MTPARRITLALICGIAAGAALPLAQRAKAGEASPALPLDDLRSFTQALDLVQSRYVDPVPVDKLFEDALRGMVDGLEPHSHYLDKNDFGEWNISSTGHYGGVGVETELHDGVVRVLAATEHTPAAAAGIQAGDIITMVDGRPISGDDIKDSIDHLRGEPGTKVRLSLLRSGLRQPIELTLTREEIKVPSVLSLMLEPGIGYLRVGHFAVDTGEAATTELENLQRQGGGALRGLILDLRGNPGGVVTAAVKLSDDFLDSGVIVTQRGRIPSANHQYRATPGDLLNGAPLVVLVDAGTASAAEILAGALQDHHRAVLVGQTTFGKGLVQSISPLQAGGAIVLTIARYYTPSGRSIQAEGIVPDVAVAEVELGADTQPAEPLREADLKGRLANEQGELALDPSGTLKPEAAARLSQTDTTLYNALNVLKGMIAGQAHAPAAANVGAG